MKRLLIVCILCAFIAGCATAKQPRWVHADKPSMKLDQEEAECNYEIGKLDAQKDIDDSRRDKLQADCLKSKGWRLDYR